MITCSAMEVAEGNGIDATPGVFAVEADRAQNLLTIRYRGRVTASAVAECLESVRSALPDMETGFRLLVDLTELEAMELACRPHLERIMRLCDEKDVSAVVRVIPDPKRDIGLQIMSYFHYRPQVQIVTCASTEEARESLAL